MDEKREGSNEIFCPVNLKIRFCHISKHEAIACDIEGQGVQKMENYKLVVVGFCLEVT